MAQLVPLNSAIASLPVCWLLVSQLLSEHCSSIKRYFFFLYLDIVLEVHIFMMNVPSWIWSTWVESLHSQLPPNAASLIRSPSPSPSPSQHQRIIIANINTENITSYQCWVTVVYSHNDWSYGMIANIPPS